MTDLSLGVLVPASTQPGAETLLYVVADGFALTLEEVQVNAQSADATSSAFGYWIYHRAMAPIGPTLGDGPVLIRQGVALTPDIPAAAKAPVPGAGKNNNVIFGPPGPSTAPDPTVAFGPVVIRSRRSINLISSPGWSYHVRLYGAIHAESP